jgi:YggT family protein
LRIGYLIATLIDLYLLFLIGRVIIDWVRMFARDWRPRGYVLMLVDVIFRMTDPPLNALRRVIPPLRIGGVAFDLGFLVLLFGLQALAGIAARLPF